MHSLNYNWHEFWRFKLKLRTENINEYRIKDCGLTQITLDDDFNVPDAKPDVDAIVKEWADVVIDEIKPVRDSEKGGTDRVCISGAMNFQILYIGRDSKDKVKPVKMEGKIPFSEWINVCDDAKGDYYTCKAVVEDLNIKAVNSRKISTRTIVTLKLSSENLCTVSLASGVEDDGDKEVLKLKKELEFVQLCVNQKDNFRIRENVSLPQGKPEIKEIVWSDIDVRNFNTRLTEGQVNITGDLDTFVMYMCDDDKKNVQWYDTTIHFEGTLDVSGASPDMIPYIAYRIVGKSIEERSDLDNENMDFFVEVVLELDIKAYEEKKKDIVCDIYSPVANIQLSCKETEFKNICVRNNSSCRVDGSMQLENCQELLQICNCTGTVSIDDCSQTDEGVLASGVVNANVFYITNNDEMPLRSVRLVIPFEQMIKINCPFNDVDINVNAYIASLSATINSTGVVEVKANVSLDTICFTRFTCQCIEDVSCNDEAGAFMEMPSMIGFFSDGTMSLWDVAKKYHTTPDLIRKTNESKAIELNETDLIPKGQKLLIVKYA